MIKCRIFNLEKLCFMKYGFFKVCWYKNIEILKLIWKFYESYSMYLIDESFELIEYFIWYNKVVDGNSGFIMEYFLL